MNWKELMKRLKLEYIKTKAPSFYVLSGGDTMRVKIYTDKTTTALSNCVSDFIKHMGGQVKPLNEAASVRMIDGKAQWIKSNYYNGSSGLGITYAGRSVNVYVSAGRSHRKEADFIAQSFPDFLQWFIQCFPEAHTPLAVLGYDIQQHLKTT